ncbi:complement C1q tumor necrosis factor-related protein 2-like [Dendropsophus ebraccatus]|uniref:complement C1q tumor necrosis factor-related protein 2-like n=1 Tax=Dendropsophus ebraccatus TaxID=150705 RepID=UPI0038312765
MQVLIWTPPASAILSLTASPLFTMESLNGTENEEPKQAYTVPLDLDLETIETDPVTDGGTQVNSQTAITSTVTPVLSNVTDGRENNIKLQEMSTMNIDPKQPITLDVFNMTSTEGPAPAIGSASKETEDNSTLIPLLDINKAYPSDEQLESVLEIPMENSTEGKECFCNIPGPAGQKGDKGDTGDPGEPGKLGKRGPQGLEGIKGKKGLSGPKGDTGIKGDKGNTGPIGAKGDKGTSCVFCEKGEKGDPGEDSAVGFQAARGEPGMKGTKGDKGPKGDPGENGLNGIDGAPGLPGEAGPKGAVGPSGPAGPKGDQGRQGNMGPPGYRGPPGIQGRKGDKGQKGSQSDHDNIAFSVAVRGQRNIVLPGRPIRFDKVFINENKPYSVNSGIFVANIEGVYFFTYDISLSHSSVMIGLAHNGKIVIQTQGRQCERSVCQASGSVLLHLREDDEIWLQVLTSAQNEFISDESDSLFTGFILYSLED